MATHLNILVISLLFQRPVSTLISLSSVAANIKEAVGTDRAVLPSAVALEVNLVIGVEQSSGCSALSLPETADLCLMGLNLESIREIRF